jgi:hypothetical protein
MKRRAFDLIFTAGGFVLTLVLLVAGILGVVGANFANNNVHNQLVEQEITFPPKAAFAHPVAGSEITPSMIPSVSQYAGELMTTGAQAEVYANDFIAVHLQEIGGGLTYVQLSTKARSLPPGSAAAAKAEATVTTVFQGTTLRGLLLEAYGFSIFGEIAGIAAICCFILAAIMLALSVIGLIHYRRTPDDADFPKASG